MDFCACVIPLVVFAASAITCNATPFTTPTSLRPTQLPVTIESMGKGYEAIPKGNLQAQTVNFAYNHIAMLPNLVWIEKQYKSLRKIDLSYNKINQIEKFAFKGLKDLEEVDLSGNNLTSLPVYCFKSNKKMDKLILSHNRIMFEEDRVFLASESLEVLILADNKIEQLFEFTFSGLPNLRHLLLDSNMIISVSSKSFLPFKQLQFLSLANTAVERLSKDMFRVCPRMLDVRNTPLAGKFKPELSTLKNEAVVNLLAMNEFV